MNVGVPRKDKPLKIYFEIQILVKGESKKLEVMLGWFFLVIDNVEVKTMNKSMEVN